MIPLTAFEPITDHLWQIPQSFRPDMRVPARVYATREMLEDASRDASFLQLVNLATLSGIRKYALAMPDVHEGYGSPIGGIAATAVAAEGIISPGMIGYDINCGVRLLRSDLTVADVQPSLDALGTALFREVPSGVGRGGWLTLADADLDAVLAGGAEEMIRRGYGDPADLDHLESRGRLAGADPGDVSSRAKPRGRDQLGTMGAGNHFVEVQAVAEVFDERAARALGLFEGQVAVMIHTGSRGLGHQVATDFIRTMLQAMPKYGISLPDRELAGVPFGTPEGQQYFRAMACGANFAWANRQLITFEVRKAFAEVFGAAAGRLGIVYDVAHNIGKLEHHEVAGQHQELLVHRKGATRAFGPGHPELHATYRGVGQPVLIPGSMGTSSFVLVGTARAMDDSFGSCCHGAGRRMSRTAARRQAHGRTVKEDLEARGIVVRSGSMAGLAEEAPAAYKDVDLVIDVVHGAGIARKVARVRPLAVIKG
jgi:tRNA-splicing ligase RtcB